jgi:cell division septation protein DedD
MLFPRSLKWAAILALPIGVAALIGVTQYDKSNSGPANNAGILSSVFSRFSAASLVEKKEAPQTAPEPQFQYDQVPSAFEQASTDILTNPGEEPVTAQPGEQTLTEPVLTESNLNANSNMEPVAEKPAKAARTDDSFVIIVGAFRSKQNAENYVEELKEKGTQASVFDRSKSGLFRVTIGTFSQREEAMQLLSSAKSGDFSGAWLLAK